jgi:c-di-GMP-related signal transduction protein
VIEDAFKHEPALTLNLLRVVNSVGRLGNRSAQPVTSLRHAITLLGRRQLQRWLSLLLLAPGNNGNDSLDPSRSPLLQVAALRGRMMELLVAVGKPTTTNSSDLAFITGILSMMPAALGLPIEEILEQIAVEREVARRCASTKVCWAPSWRCSSASTATTPRAATACCPCSPATLTARR